MRIKLLFLSIVLVLPSSVLAGSFNVVNNISTSASTGDNKSVDGEMVEGEARSSVKVFTEVNGEVVTDFEKEEISETGNATVEYEVEKEVATEVPVGVAAEKVPEKSLVRKILNYVFTFFKF